MVKSHETANNALLAYNGIDEYKWDSISVNELQVEKKQKDSWN